MAYIDGFVAAVPTAKKDEYLVHCKVCGDVSKEYGALGFVECWGVDVPDGEVSSFAMAVKKKDDETVVFSWIEWPDKATRDAGMPKIMADERLSHENLPMPFDGKRLIMGGFEVIMRS